MRPLNPILTLAVLTSLMTGCLSGAFPSSSPRKVVRLLTVGNSFSANACQYLPALAKASGNSLIWHQAGIGGGTMAQHWAKFECNEHDPKDPEGRYAITQRSLREELTAEPWDFVTLQQASVFSHNPATYRPYARQFQDLIKSLAPQAQLLMHQTWAYRADDARFTGTNTPPDEPKTQQAMVDQLTAAYNTIAAELGVGVIPVGDAFSLADTDPVWGFKPDTNFDPATAVFPALPKQTHSLHMGWQWKNAKGKKTLGMDGHHASVAGRYLATCVFYEVLFKESTVGNKYRPKGLDAAYARFLQETAHKAVLARTVPPPAGHIDSK